MGQTSKKLHIGPFALAFIALISLASAVCAQVIKTDETKGAVGVGIAPSAPTRLSVAGPDAIAITGVEPFITFNDQKGRSDSISHRIQSGNGDLAFLQGRYIFAPGRIGWSWSPRMVIRESGNVGIGTTKPSHQLGLGRGPSWTSSGWGGAMELESASAIGWKANAAGNRFGIGATGGGLYFFHTASDPGTTGAKATYDLTITDAGTVSVRVLQITGGSDFSENFDVNTKPADSRRSDAQVAPGMVVSIDPINPGALELSSHAYDRRVAGIISGAGGVQPGMVMGQEGSIASGKLPVALTGRVYCWVDASFGLIEPGDLLTTSNTAGYAMKVGNYAEAQGAIIGKAMTGLKRGKGLVLVLVALQ